ncbi:MAG: branched-chain amino acid ABC transporter permease [Actinomycetia bacterium]|nr:branched-chain amino acid ABC transporter permease [Actinomycetes bacterium]
MQGRSRTFIWAVLAFVVIGVAFAIMQTSWWDSNDTVFIQAVVSGMLIGGVYGLVAMGLSLVFGVLDIINFAHGALMTIGIYASYLLFQNYGIDPYLSLLVTVPLLFVVGMGIQRFAINPVMTAPVHNQLLLTLGIAIMIENLLLVFFTGTPRSIELSYARGSFDLGFMTLDFPLRVFGAVVSMPKLIAFVMALVLALVLYILIQRTWLGAAIRASAQQPEGAELVGIDNRRIYIITFGIGAAAAGAAGGLVMPFLFVSPTAGATFTIIAFIVVVLGGMGSIPGAVVGGFIIGLTQELSQLFVSGSSKLLGVFVVFILVLLFRPQGLFGARQR